MSEFRDSTVSLSMVASWSWGSSLLVGISIMQGYGPGPFAIWALFNITAVPVFILVADRTEFVSQVRALRPIFITMIALQIFVVFINLQAIFEGASGGLAFDSATLVNADIGQAVALALGLGIVVAIHRWGFTASVVSDQIQYAIQLCGCFALVVVAIAYYGLPMSQAADATADGYLWAVWTGLGILAAPYLDAQQHQRVEYISSSAAGLLFGVGFGVYLVGVALAGSVLVATAPALTLILLVPVLAVTTSTLDSAVAALQYLVGRRPATVLAGSAVLAWPLVQSLGVLGIFTLYSSGRLVVVTTALVYLVVWTRYDIPAILRRFWTASTIPRP